MNQRSAALAYEVLHCFKENSSYEDYRDGDDTPFTDEEYEQMLAQLRHLTTVTPPPPGEGVQHIRLTLDVFYALSPSDGVRPDADQCAQQLDSSLHYLVDNGMISGDHDFHVNDYPYRIEQITATTVNQLIPEPS